MNTRAQHIVVVDDEAPAREMVGDYLRLHGFEVTLCDGGGSLRKHLEKQTADLIVLDLNMPEEDGLSIVRWVKQLLARIRVVLRRGTAPAAAAAPTPATRAPIRFGTKWLDVDARVLRDDGGNEHPLASSEFALLKAFAENPKRVLSRERLLDLAEARDREAFDRAIDVRITRIRRKIEPDPARPSVIRTVRGAGYLFSPDGSDPG
jgi:two-component system OmpR family response regulator